MPDTATPNLPSRDFAATIAFYAPLDFEKRWEDAGWLILRRGDLQLEFFRWPDFDPDQSGYGSCLRMADITPLWEQAVAAGIPEANEGRPRLHRPRREAWGGLVGSIIDPDGSLLRLIQE